MGARAQFNVVIPRNVAAACEQLQLQNKLGLSIKSTMSRKRMSSCCLKTGTPHVKFIRSSIKIKCKANEDDDVIRDEAVNPQELERWQDSRQRLLDLGLMAEEAERVLGKSSGYLKSPYWGENKEVSVPAVEEVSRILDYLKGVGLGDADLMVVVKKFPEVLGCKLESEIEKNVGILDSSWGISGTTLRNLLLRKPQVLGYTVDCKGDCMAECTRCWARF